MARRAGAPGAWSPRGRGDQGASSMEWALLTPIIILVLLAVVQFAMVYHARHVALAAAQSGARVARTQPEGGGWRDEAVAKATGDVRKIGPNLLGGLRVAAGEEGDQRWVQVSGEAVKVIPFMSFHVEQRSEGPIECFRPDVDGGTACQGDAP
ncbi:MULTISPECIES: TadE family protein [Thermomonosporaceae]|uniref:TadE family protein n=1 Tax=Thermomonosporaceae TaxID=2012 RepID=UPI00255AF4E8|nr:MULTISPECIES: TadE family protein [Thermomonosporaceae]MDL4776117.1 pilus assembly protein [Actinomadura xylanilytica]